MSNPNLKEKLKLEAEWLMSGGQLDDPVWLARRLKITAELLIEAMESISVAKTSLSSLGGYWSTCCPMCESEFHFESPDVDYRKKIPMNEHQKTAILDSRNIAMYNCVKARIPECGEFAKIAQHLDWLCDTLHIEKDDDQRSTD